jgi:hypothetical protein
MTLKVVQVDSVPADGKENQALTTSESARLVELEGVIERGLKSFIVVGLALQEIRGSKLYRTEHKTFEDYLDKRWALSRRYSRQLLTRSQKSKVLRRERRW